jgi:hypothetical protein
VVNRLAYVMATLVWWGNEFHRYVVSARGDITVCMRADDWFEMGEALLELLSLVCLEQNAGKITNGVGNVRIQFAAPHLIDRFLQ